jgi:hypothetical protein
MERVPFRAPRSPPETGASSVRRPFSAAAAAIRIAREGLEVVISIRRLPAAARSIMPPFPR